MGSALRVLQATDLNLHKPLESIGKLPTSLREVLNHARERTAMKVFNAAINSNAQVLLLTGSLAHFESEPRLAYFLMDQFQRLTRAGVRVVWVTDEPFQLPGWALPPDHVTCLQSGQSIAVQLPGSLEVGSNITDVVRRIHLSWPKEDSLEEFGIAKRSQSSGDLEIRIDPASSTRAMEGITYSIGNQFDSIRAPIVPTQSDGPGTNQTSGMWLFEYHPSEAPQLKLLPTASVDWRIESVNLQPYPSLRALLGDISTQCRSEQRCFNDSANCELTFVSWELTGESQLWDELLEQAFSDRLIENIRQQTARESRRWPWQIIMHPPAHQFGYSRHSRPRLRDQRHCLQESQHRDLTSGRERQAHENLLRRHQD